MIMPLSERQERGILLELDGEHRKHRYVQRTQIRHNIQGIQSKKRLRRKDGENKGVMDYGNRRG
jgi:hypothetical protein